MDVTPTLRPIQPADMPFLFDVYASTRAEELARVPWPHEAKREFLTQQFNAQHTHYQREFSRAQFDIIELEGRPIGRLYVDRAPEEIQLIDIALLPEHRNRGVGSHLIGKVLNESRASGLPVHIYVERSNPALRLYQRLGFKELSDTGIYLYMEWRPS